MFTIESFPVGQLQCNCSIIYNFDSKEALVVDPGDEFEVIWKKITKEKLSLLGIWHTHAHLDHIGATKKLYDAAKKENTTQGKAAPKIFLHKEDLWLYNNVTLQASLIGLANFEVSSEIEFIDEKTPFPFFPEQFTHYSTPGHTPGSSCLDLNAKCDLHVPNGYSLASYEESAPIIFTGDTLFRRSVGRTDLWGGSAPTLTRSIRNKLYSIEGDRVVIPGHGPITSLEEERVKNEHVRLK